MKVSVEEALGKDRHAFVDIRSEGEFETDRIQGALNLPLFNNDERARVGTLYKENRNQAKIEGLRIASSKVVELYTRIHELSAAHDRVVVYCWRGGMRSRSVVALLRSLGLGNVVQLEGGYKAYRSRVNAYLENEVEELTFVVVHGRTGVGKTDILKRLKERGSHVLDLEAHASNSGSVFGRIPFGGRGPTQKYFETLLFSELSRWDDYFLLESESKRIGDLHLRENFFQAMKKGRHILVETSMDNRVEIIAKDYVTPGSEEQILGAIRALRKRLGNDKTEELLEDVRQGRHRKVIRFLMASYYDALYDYSINQVPAYDLTIAYDTQEEAVRAIEGWLQDNMHFKRDKEREK